MSSQTRYRYFTCDVFTKHRFTGNPLAVIPEAAGLDATQMLKIAQEFNFSETTFVFPARNKGDHRVRIFTPTMEVPFAGHPNIGTAFLLARNGAFGDIGAGVSVQFEEQAGTVIVSIQQDSEGLIWCELEAPQDLSLGKAVSSDQIARVLSLDVSDIVTSTHQPQEASVGLPFLMVELTTVSALQKARVNISELEIMHGQDVTPDIHAYTRSRDEFDIRARMFAPFDRVPEDPATGSANCALVALLTHSDQQYESGGSWHIAQGVEMGRPSSLRARTSKVDRRIRTWIGGHCVYVSEGFIDCEMV